MNLYLGNPWKFPLENAVAFEFNSILSDIIRGHDLVYVLVSYGEIGENFAYFLIHIEIRDEKYQRLCEENSTWNTPHRKLC